MGQKQVVGRRRRWGALIGIGLALVGTVSARAEATIGVDEIKPGMRGEWRTVVSGTEIVSYPLEVIGLAPNFAGPQRTIILCRALDPQNLESGPVGGMSGSPVYFDGRLAGAYAYGFTWPKNQAILGVTPIADMLEVLEFAAPDGPGRLARTSTTASSGLGNATLASAGSGAAPVPPAAAALNLETAAGAAERLTVPMLAGGFSARTLAAFADTWREFGLAPMAAPSGSTMGPGEEGLEPGGAVAGVLMAGDFTFVGTGTVTWRDGNRLLGFGHPFFSFGPTAIPMASAEILTVIQAVPRSFKLSNHGPIVGTISQDRLSAIAGEIGPVPPMTSLQVRVQPVAGPARTFRAAAFQHPRLTATLVGMAMMEALEITQETVEEGTFSVRGTVEVEGHGPIEVRQSSTRSMALAMGWMTRLRALLDNPFEPVQVTSIDLEATITPGWQNHVLKAVQVIPTRVRPGTDLVLAVTMARPYAEPMVWPVRLRVPDDVRPGEKLTILLADAATAAAAADGVGGPVGSVADLVAQWRAERSSDQLYALLLRPAAGLQIAGANLPDLPPSVRATLTAGATRTIRADLSEVVVGETAIALTGPFEGSYRLEVTVE